MLVEGHPARVRSLNIVGLKRAGMTTTENGTVYQTLKKAFRIIYRSGLTLNEALEKIELLPENDHLQHLQQFLHLSQQQGRRGPIPGKHLGTSVDDKDE